VQHTAGKKIAGFIRPDQAFCPPPEGSARVAGRKFWMKREKKKEKTQETVY